MNKRILKICVIFAALLLCIFAWMVTDRQTANNQSSLPGITSQDQSGSTLLDSSGTTSQNQSGTTSQDSSGALSVWFFQAGKADAALIMTDHYTVLIDCGVKGFGQTILDYLAEQAIDHIDYLIITHFDQDHVGGAAKVINNIPVYNVLQNNSPKDSSEYEKYVKALTNAGTEPVIVTETMTFTLDGVTFTVDPAKSLHYAEDESNNSSLLVTVVNGDNTFLFMGDAQTERLEEYLEGETVDCDVIKIPHHGGEEILMEDLIAATAPEYAVITSSDEEPESASTISVLESADVETYLTREGGVLITSDGRAITVDAGN